MQLPHHTKPQPSQTFPRSSVRFGSCQRYAQTTLDYPTPENRAQKAKNTSSKELPLYQTSLDGDSYTELPWDATKSRNYIENFLSLFIFGLVLHV